MALPDKKIEIPVPRHVFEDLSGKRLRSITIWLTLIFVVVVVFVADFGYRVYTLKPPLPASQVFTPGSATEGQLTPGSDAISVVMKDSAFTDCGQGLLNFTSKPTGLAGYIPFNNVTALAGLRAHCDDLDAVYFEAFKLNPLGEGVSALDPKGAAFPLEEFNTGFVSRNRPESFPVLSPALGTTTAQLERYFSDPAQIANLQAQLYSLDLTGVDGGFCLDLKNHAEINSASITPIFSELNSWLGPKGLRSCLIGKIDSGFWQDPELVELVGQSVLLGFQTTTGPTIPIATQDWFDHAAIASQSQIAPEKSSFALGSFSRAWKSGQRSPEEISFAEAMLRANYFDGSMHFSAESGYSSIRFIDAARKLNQIWVQDAASFHNQRLSLDGDAQITIWPLGYEDPAIWGLVDTDLAVESVLEAEIDLSNHVIIEGSGPFSEHIEEASQGIRLVSLSEIDGRVEALSYTRIPSPRRIQLYGESAELDLVIAFNGLGSAFQTETLLEELDRHGINATFFLSFDDLLISESIVKTLISAGHSIGVQTEPQNSQSVVTRFATTGQNNLTQLLLQDNFGHNALLVQNPSRFGEYPGDIAVLDQLQDLQTAGFIPVYSNMAAPLGDFDPLLFSQNIGRMAFDASANIISFDFSVQNDSVTNSMLPTILDQLTEDGFGFTDLAGISGLTQNQVFPESNFDYVARDQIMFWLMSITWFGVQNFIFLMALIVALHSPIYLFLAFIRREKFPYDKNYHPPVTIIIPAFNEAKVIQKTLDSVLASDYPNFDVIVVDDGSNDNTSSIVVEAAKLDSRIRLIEQENHGKWFAEDHALNEMKTPIFVIVDADTLLQKDAIKYLVQPFKSAAVGAVAGTVEIGNRDNLLTACQVVEYKISQNVMRRAYEVFNGIIVVPGAIGAWRTQAVIESGLVSGDTITEDADLTLAVNRANYKVMYAPEAKSYTEAPNSMVPFMQQRLRWSLGMLQVSWKHRGAIAEGRAVGLISIVEAVWYRAVSSFIFPLIDLILIYALGSWVYSVFEQGTMSLNSITSGALLLLIVLTFLDVLNLMAAFWFERRIEWKLLFLVPLLRFGYWQLLYIPSIRSFMHAFSGRLRGWQKLKRTDTAIIFDEAK